MRPGFQSPVPPTQRERERKDLKQSNILRNSKLKFLDTSLKTETIGSYFNIIMFWQYWGLNSGRQALYHLSHSTSP
jgi:hypothetical protein